MARIPAIAHVLAALGVGTVCLSGCDEAVTGPAQYPADTTIPPITQALGPYVITQQESDRATVATAPLDSIMVVVVNDPTIVCIATVNAPCFGHITIRNVRLRYQRFWRNLSSRLLGPGTTYSITYGWREGVSESNSSQVATTLGITVGAKVAVEAGVDKVVVAKVMAELSVQVSATLSQTNTYTVTFNSERFAEETQSVSGRDGVDRVYTVWQLVNAFDVVDSAGVRVDESYVRRLPQYTAYVSQINAACQSTNTCAQVNIVHPQVLYDGTAFFAQATQDFPRR